MKFKKPGSSQNDIKHSNFKNRVKTPTILQMEATECGAACLGIILEYFGKVTSLEELRIQCGVSRDGVKAINILKAGRKYGLAAKPLKCETDGLWSIKPPVVIHWNFNHFLVLEGFKGDKAYINDPAMGPRTISLEELDQSFTGIVLQFQPNHEFVRGSKKENLFKALLQRLAGSEALFFATALTGFALIFPGIALPVFSKIFVDSILTRGMYEWIWILAAAMGITAALRSALTYLKDYSLLKLQTNIAVRESGRFFWHLCKLPMEFFTQRYAGDIAARLKLNNNIANLITDRFISVVLDIIMVTFYLILMLKYDILLTFVSIFIAAINVIFLKLSSERRVTETQQMLMENGKFYSTSIEGMANIETIKASGEESSFFTKWAGYHARLVKSEQKLGVSRSYMMSSPRLTTAFNFAVIICIGSMRVINGDMTLGTLVAYQTLMGSFLYPFGSLVQFGSSLQELKGSILKIDDVLLHPEISNSFEVSDQAEDASAFHDKHESKLSGQIELKNVSFGYSKLEAPLLENFSLILKPGRQIALIGGSGSGKSTVSKLIMGLYEPWSGEILFDGKPRSSLSPTSFYNSISLVDQDIFLFEGSIRQNISMWRNEISDQVIVNAAKDACIFEDIMERQDGFESIVDENGRNFSAGQRQRIELARALATDPKVLVLDEATSALDPITEKVVVDNLKTRGCSCLIVAHRLSIIRDCDEIIVMDKGKIVQRGTHLELSDIEGPYHKLLQNQ